MSRIRSLKPEFFRSRSLARVPRDARTTFQGLWCEADDVGRGIADPRLLKGAVWPLDDDITSDVIEGHLQALAVSDHIALYAVRDERYYVVLNWEAHQSSSLRRGLPKYPPPPAGVTSVYARPEDGVTSVYARPADGVTSVYANGSRAAQGSEMKPCAAEDPISSPPAERLPWSSGGFPDLHASSCINVLEQGAGSREQGGEQGRATESRGVADPPGFEGWWSAYPRKLSKADAVKAYRKALDEGATTEQLTASLAAWRAVWITEGRSADKVPYAGTWLRRGDWRETPDPPRPAVSTNRAAIDRVLGSQPPHHRHLSAIDARSAPG